MIKIGIVGSRRRNSQEDMDLLTNELAKRIEKYGIENITLVSGGCPKGGDHFAELIQKAWNFPNEMIIHYPDKSKLDPDLMSKNPRAAYAVINYARNTLIAEDSDELIAIVASDRKGGTEDTVKKFKKIDKEKNLTLL